METDKNNAELRPTTIAAMIGFVTLGLYLYANKPVPAQPETGRAASFISEPPNLQEAPTIAPPLARLVPPPPTVKAIDPDEELIAEKLPNEPELFGIEGGRFVSEVIEGPGGDDPEAQCLFTAGGQP